MDECLAVLKDAKLAKVSANLEGASLVDSEVVERVYKKESESADLTVDEMEAIVVGWWVFFVELLLDVL